MEKAAREAKEQTSWTQPNKEFEDALKTFIERILDSQEFIAELESFVAQILLPGRINSLAQTLIKCTAPGSSGHVSRQRDLGPCGSSIPTIAGHSTMNQACDARRAARRA